MSFLQHGAATIVHDSWYSFHRFEGLTSISPNILLIMMILTGVNAAGQLYPPCLLNPFAQHPGGGGGNGVSGSV